MPRRYAEEETKRSVRRKKLQAKETKESRAFGHLFDRLMKLITRNNGDAGNLKQISVSLRQINKGDCISERFPRPYNSRYYRSVYTYVCMYI